MKKKEGLEYLKMGRFARFWYSIWMFICSIPGRIVNLAKKIWTAIKKAGIWIYSEVKDIIMTFVHGDWKTRTSYLIMGFGNIARGQVLRGILFL
ncbi:MAG: hypothetical protein II739_06780, partial [Clostridia bacterium]|nr:hypothetical protein [Clostridia bacterium]